MTAPRVAIIGAGMAGASLAYFLGDRAQVTLVEREAYPGYHTTGRSAAFYAETYGGPAVQPLTTASKSFFAAPPTGFAGTPLLRPRGAIYVADAGALAGLAEVARVFAGTGVQVESLSPGRLAQRVPQLREAWRVGALEEPGCRDIDVAALHQGFLAGARRAGARLVTDAGVNRIERGPGGWRIDTAGGALEADILVNAAGAWGDRIASLVGVTPLGLAPLRRTIVSVEVDSTPPADLPLVIAADGSFYFKPDAGRLWISPHDETPCEPSDVQPEEYDVAVAIDRLERATTWKVRRIDRAWAGLRTFAPDRAPVYGFDRATPGFFWCVGQGGAGIQTAPAAARLGAALLLGDPVPDDMDAGRYAPERLR